MPDDILGTWDYVDCIEKKKNRGFLELIKPIYLKETGQNCNNVSETQLMATFEIL